MSSLHTHMLQNLINETVDIIKRHGFSWVPRRCCQCDSTCFIEATNELMKHKDTNLISATGGNVMVKAAYSSGTPALV